MALNKFLIINSFLFTIIPIFAQNGTLLTINTSRGTVVGFRVDQGNDTTQNFYGQADVFLGIPYALPPIGYLRHKPPRPIFQYPNNPNQYNATFYRSACIQPGLDMDQISEDCLYWNVFSPNTKTKSLYPVMIFIHGGGLITGDSHYDVNSLVRNFATKNVAFASLDYRMGWLGFFTTFTDDFQPNIGMLDQLLALKFIKEEITYFGADPNKITIFGESAGGHSVSSHTYSPLSQNLFQQVIMESGTVLTCYEDSVGPTNRNFLVANILCNYTQAMWDAKNYTDLTNCLMNLSVDSGLAVMNKFGVENSVCWNMVQDNYFMPNPPQILGPKRPNIPAIIGNCRDEYAMWEMTKVKKDRNLTSYTRQLMESGLTQQYSTWWQNQSQVQTVLKIFEDNYLPAGTTDDDHMAWLQFAVDVGTPAYFTKGALLDVERYVSNNNPSVYAYEFVWSSTVNNNGNPLKNWHPVPHVCELPYLLSYVEAWSDDDKMLANSLQEMWTNFAKSGKPTSDNTWASTTSKNFSSLEYLQINLTSSMKSGYRATDQLVWNNAIAQVLGDYPPNQPDTSPICSKGYQSKITNTTCYEAFGVPQNWSAALENCGKNSYGTFVTIKNAFENSDLLGYAKNAFASCPKFYIGLFQSNYTSNWNWLNYDLNGYTNWKSGSPQPNPNFSCVVLNTNDGSWTNEACDTAECYVCSR